MNSVATRMQNVFQGEFVVSDDPLVCLTTVLGSCVAACIYDAERGIGGLNHFLLPAGRGGGGGGDNLRYGVHSMELLINGLLRGGAVRSRLCAKLFGGARMLDELSDIGRSNAEFALDYLRDEGIACLNQSLLGTQARRVRFWPATGRAQQMLVQRIDVPDAVVAVAPQPAQSGSEVTLF